MGEGKTTLEGGRENALCGGETFWVTGADTILIGGGGAVYDGGGGMFSGGTFSFDVTVICGSASLVTRRQSVFKVDVEDESDTDLLGGT